MATNYSDELRKLRVSKNISLKKLAEDVGVHHSYLSKIEHGEANPSNYVQLKIESVLGYTPAVPTESFDLDVEETKESDSRNKLNDLTGKEWIVETKSIWRQKGLGANHEHTKFEKLHPAPFSYQDITRLIRFFTKKGMLVLDPFCGVGSTLKAAAIEGRRGLGVELSPKWAELAKLRLNEEVPGHQGQQIWCSDIRSALKKIDDETVDFIVTSPPYWSILNKNGDHKTKAVRLSNGLAQNYSDSPDDLGNIEDYETFLNILAGIFNDLSSKLVAGKYCAIIVSDFKHSEKFYSFHSDLCEKIDSSRLALQGITVLAQEHKALYPYGYPFAYVPNIHHQYILLFRKPTSKQQKNKAVSGKEIKTRITNKTLDVESAISQLAELPYTKGDMASRHWGNNRHSICSFPSKMKPSLASTLVNLFSVEGSTLLDPFSGSGTIPFEGALQGRFAIASDLSPLAYIISSAKISPPSHEETNKLLEDLKSHISSTWKKVRLNEEMEDEILQFYHEQTAKEIVAARSFLYEKSKRFSKGDVALFVTACLAHVLHGNRPYALSRRSHNIIPIPPKGDFIYKPVMDALNDKCSRMLEYPLTPNFIKGKVIKSDASKIALDDSSIDEIMTSPPFLGTTDFIRQNRVRNWLVGWDYETQEKKKPQFLENQKGASGYLPIFNNLFRILKPQGLLILHIGIVKDVNMADLLSPYLLQSGFREIGRIWEDTSKMESHGRTDRGSTHTHGIVICMKD